MRQETERTACLKIDNSDIRKAGCVGSLAELLSFETFWELVDISLTLGWKLRDAPIVTALTSWELANSTNHQGVWCLALPPYSPNWLLSIYQETTG